MNKQYGTRRDHPVQKIADGVYQINEFGLASSYLVLGGERALLIDVGTGIGDLLGAVRNITQLPLTVVGTHAHPDHIGGRGQFPEIYLHGADCTRTMRMMCGKFGRSLMLAGMPKAQRAQFCRKDLTKPAYDTKWLPVEDGHVFRLGGREVTVTHTPGHTRGSIVLRDMQEDILFTGDNVCTWLWLFLPGAVSVEAWIPSGKKVLELARQCRAAYNAHRPDAQPLEEIEKLITFGEALVRQCKKNTILPRLRVFPKGDKKSPKLVYLTNKVLKNDAR